MKKGSVEWYYQPITINKTSDQISFSGYNSKIVTHLHPCEPIEIVIRYLTPPYCHVSQILSVHCKNFHKLEVEVNSFNQHPREYGCVEIMLHYCNEATEDLQDKPTKPVTFGNNFNIYLFIYLAIHPSIHPSFLPSFLYISQTFSMAFFTTFERFQVYQILGIVSILHKR